MNRRYSDFLWLFQEISDKYLGYIFPPLPEKSAFAKINLIDNT